MICERCQGSGQARRPLLDHSAEAGADMFGWPCPDCEGSGLGHCCDGLRAQAGEPDADRKGFFEVPPKESPSRLAQSAPADHGGARARCDRDRALGAVGSR